MRRTDPERPETPLPARGYSRLQIALHWMVAVLVPAAWITGDGMGRVLRQKIEGGEPGLPIHAWIGHSLRALWHHYARRDRTLVRMLRPGHG